jgi:GT2 family glycosyltransferase
MTHPCSEVETLSPNPRRPTVTVVIGTLPGREDNLKRCLAGLDGQTRAPEEVLVLEGMPSMIAVIREGLRRARSDWIAFVDDDAVPQTTWLEALSRHFDDPEVGAVGGRILNFTDGRTTARHFTDGPIARISWYGRTIQQLDRIPVHEIVRDVAFLPGSNMCFRRAALRHVDEQLDVGMAPGNEMGLCMGLRRDGWLIRFDSGALVSHYPAPRPERIARDDRTRHAREYSEVVTYTLLKYSSWPRRLAFFAYFFLIGQRASPGLAFAPYCLLSGQSRDRFRAAWSGKLRGLRKALA